MLNTLKQLINESGRKEVITQFITLIAEAELKDLNNFEKLNSLLAEMKQETCQVYDSIINKVQINMITLERQQEVAEIAKMENHNCVVVTFLLIETTMQDSVEAVNEILDAVVHHIYTDDVLFENYPTVKIIMEKAMNPNLDNQLKNPESPNFLKDHPKNWCFN